MLHLLLITLALLTTALTAPTLTQPNATRCTALVENTPWHLEHIFAFYANPALPSGVSSCGFDFCDSNPGLELTTHCEHDLPVHSGLGPVDHDNFYPCQNDSVWYRYDGYSFTVRRSYVDDCLGEYPYNSGNFFGTANTTFISLMTRFGAEWLQATLDMYITAQD